MVLTIFEDKFKFMKPIKLSLKQFSHFLTESKLFVHLKTFETVKHLGYEKITLFAAIFKYYYNQAVPDIIPTC